MTTLSPKDPDSEEIFNWDCRTTINSAAGGTIASIVLGPFQETGYGDGAITVLTTAAVDASGYIISAMLGRGTHDVTYRMTVRFRTTVGELLDHTVEFLCANALV